jgi:N-methylhydantoinase B/oxoprolinase/acetone carboxylase alpha subunit
VKIVTSNARMRALINKALAKEGEQVLKTASSNIRSKVKEVVRRAIATCPEM